MPLSLRNSDPGPMLQRRDTGHKFGELNGCCSVLLLKPVYLVIQIGVRSPQVADLAFELSDLLVSAVSAPIKILHTPKR